MEAVVMPNIGQDPNFMKTLEFDYHVTQFRTKTQGRWTWGLWGL